MGKASSIDLGNLHKPSLRITAPAGSGSGRADRGNAILIQYNAVPKGREEKRSKLPL